MRFGLIALLAIGLTIPLGLASAIVTCASPPPPFIGVGTIPNPTYVAAGVCQRSETWGYDYTPASECQFVPPVEIQGQPVPETGQVQCTPTQTVSEAGGGVEPVVTVCIGLSDSPTPTCEEQTIYTDPNCFIANSPFFHFFGNGHCEWTS